VVDRVDRRTVIENVFGSQVTSEVMQAVARREPPASAGAAVHVSRIPEEVNMNFRHHLPRVARRCSAPARCLRGARCPGWRAEGRDRACSSSCSGPRSTDGAVAPVGDPDWIGCAATGAGARRQHTGIALDSFFALIPRWPNLHRLYRAQQANHRAAAARPIASARISMARTFSRADRAPVPSIPAGSSRVVELASDGQVDLRGSRALGVGAVTPLVVRARPPVMSWVPQKLLPAAMTRRRGY